MDYKVPWYRYAEGDFHEENLAHHYLDPAGSVHRGQRAAVCVPQEDAGRKRDPERLCGSVQGADRSAQ